MPEQVFSRTVLWRQNMKGHNASILSLARQFIPIPSHLGLATLYIVMSKPYNNYQYNCSISKWLNILQFTQKHVKHPEPVWKSSFQDCHSAKPSHLQKALRCIIKKRISLSHFDISVCFPLNSLILRFLVRHSLANTRQIESQFFSSSFKYYSFTDRNMQKSLPSFLPMLHFYSVQSRPLFFTTVKEESAPKIPFKLSV